MFTLKTHQKKIIADKLTPVSIYLKIRDLFPNSILLESSDYDSSQSNYSYIGFNPLASIELNHKTLTVTLPDNTQKSILIESKDQLLNEIDSFISLFDTEELNYKFMSNGLFGFMSHEMVSIFENLELNDSKENLEVPTLYYAIYQNIIAINIFNHEAYLFSHCYNQDSNIEEIERIIKKPNHQSFPFAIKKGKESNFTDSQYKELVELGKKHCQRGDVFQLVLSRRFSQQFTGDDFNVYRSLRSINPSPYLFYFDYGSFKIFGSSPEAQLIISKGKAEIHPIAGTFKRTENEEKDLIASQKLLEDPKENSEHVMLVDLARNDLSRNGDNVKVEKYKEIQKFSHVIHLVSKVTSEITKNSLHVVADTFPAGTLSGAPKHKALQLIDQYETTKREFYGGAIGMMNFNGEFNHAIIIRSFLSKDHVLYSQAGAGIVVDSKAESELQEVYNKLGALDKAIELAQTL